MHWGFPCSSVGKEAACNAGEPGSIPGSGKAPGGGNGNLLQSSCLETPTDRAWRAADSGVAELDTSETKSSTYTWLRGPAVRGGRGGRCRDAGASREVLGSEGPCVALAVGHEACATQDEMNYREWR